MKTHRCTSDGLNARIHEHEKAQEEALRAQAKEQLELLFAEVQEREDRLRDSEVRSNGYRPDETDLFRDIKDQRYWDESHREFEER